MKVREWLGDNDAFGRLTTNPKQRAAFEDDEDDDIVQMPTEEEIAAYEAERVAKYGLPWAHDKTDAEVEAELERRMVEWRAERDARPEVVERRGMTVAERDAQFKSELQALREHEAEVDSEWMAIWEAERDAKAAEEVAAMRERVRGGASLLLEVDGLGERAEAIWAAEEDAADQAFGGDHGERVRFEQEVEQRERSLRVDKEARKRLAEAEAATSLRSWEPVPFDDILDKITTGTLDLPKPEVGMVTGTDLGLFYLGRVNGIAGESGGGKGWIALRTALEQMKLGRDFYYIDFEDSPDLALLRLVKGLGADPALLKERMHYIHPEEHNLTEIQRLVDAVSRTPDAFIAIDSTGESIAQSGRVQNNDDEVAAWFQELPHALSRAGATVVLIDHLVKSPEGGLWPAGSHRKRASITGAQYVLEVAEAPSVESDGLVILKVAKDRGGARSAGSAASFVRFTHDPFSGKLHVTFDPGKTVEELKAERAAKAAAAAAAQLAEDVDTLRSLTSPPLSQRDVKERLGWGSTRAAEALREFRSGASS